MKTPIINLGIYENNSLYIKREDMLPFSFGGNKFRIAKELFKDMEEKGYNCIVGYGNARSNMCRVLSNIAFAEKLPCYIVSPSDDDGSRTETFNSCIVNDCNANIVFCSKDEVKQTVESVLSKCKSFGLKPYYMYGDSKGKGNEQVLSRAYKKVFLEILAQEQELGVNFDYLFLPAGTGMTYSGLVIGKIACKSNMKLVGISISRNKEKCALVLDDYLEALGINNINIKDCIDFDDEYLCGGYGKYTSCIENIIDYSVKNYGISLDPTYTGKAFYGMTEYLKKNKIENKKILFLHTGGTPLFFDYYREEKFKI